MILAFKSIGKALMTDASEISIWPERSALGSERGGGVEIFGTAVTAGAGAGRVAGALLAMGRGGSGLAGVTLLPCPNQLRSNPVNFDFMSMAMMIMPTDRLRQGFSNIRAINNKQPWAAKIVPRLDSCPKICLICVVKLDDEWERRLLTKTGSCLAV
jgi:hypothetical protein